MLPLDRLAPPLVRLPDDLLQHRLHEDQRIFRDLADSRSKPAQRLQHCTLLMHLAP